MIEDYKKEDGTKILDVAAYVKSFFFKANDNDNYVLWIGCDSKYLKHGLSEYIVVICFYKWGKGAHVIHRRVKLKTASILDRLWKEVELSVELAEHLRKENIFVMKSIKREKSTSIPEIIWNLNKSNKGIIFIESQQYLPNFMNCVDFKIDVDFNGKSMYESNKLHDSAVYFINGLGYHCMAKPSAFAATYAANNLL